MALWFCDGIYIVCKQFNLHCWCLETNISIRKVQFYGVVVISFFLFGLSHVAIHFQGWTRTESVPLCNNYW